MSIAPPVCQTIKVFAFRGDRSGVFTERFQKALDDEKKGLGPGPTAEECLLYAGHTGVSTDSGTTIYGFNPDRGGLSAWTMFDRLRRGNAFPGVVRDDTAVFTAARNHPLPVFSFDIVLPDPRFQLFKQTLDGDRPTSQYSYGFPNGDGDCNCTTWLERLGLPLLTGLMDEFIGLSAVSASRSRRFGLCV